MKALVYRRRGMVGNIISRKTRGGQYDIHGKSIRV